MNGCVEVAALDELIAVRDSKDPTGPVLFFDQHEWSSFLGGVSDGEFAFASLRDESARPAS
jgi:hypothetical protein